MSKKKGLSASDKQEVILGIYQELKLPMNLKEIENLASKRGVVQQTVKEMNQILVDDFVIYSDKIGSANFFWSFPSKALVDKTNLKEEKEATVSFNKEACEKYKEEISVNKETRKSEGRPENIKRLNQLRLQEVELDKALQAGKDNDPVEIQKIMDTSEVAKAAADRWVDNTFEIKSYLTKKKGMQGKEVDKMMGINDSFDYVEFEVAKPGKGKKK